MRFKPGDRVRIKTLEDIHETLDPYGESSNHTYFNPIMAAFCGETAVVKEIEITERIILNDIKEPNGSSFWHWCEEWLEPAEETFSDIIMRGI